MIKKILTKKLRVGMYVNLSKSWLRHPFPTSKFIIKSQSQIKQIAASGIKEVNVDTEKSQIVTELPSTKYPRTDQTDPEEPDSMELILNGLREELDDDQLEPLQKAEVVYSNSIDMMENLLDQPTIPNIMNSKMIIAVVINHLLVDDKAMNNLMTVVARDYHTYTHSVNVGVLSTLLAKELFQGGRMMNTSHILEIGIGCFLHDLGKCDVAGSIFEKQGKLTAVEIKQMHSHPGHGFEILANSKQLSNESKHIVLEHHERADGSGYPRGIKGDEINYSAKICSVVDMYEALTSERPYKKSISSFEALKIIKEEMVTNQNREIFQALVTVLGH